MANPYNENDADDGDDASHALCFLFSSLHASIFLGLSFPLAEVDTIDFNCKREEKNQSKKEKEREREREREKAIHMNSTDPLGS